jgi:hypothetical protein
MTTSDDREYRLAHGYSIAPAAGRVTPQVPLSSGHGRSSDASFMPNQVTCDSLEVNGGKVWHGRISQTC